MATETEQLVVALEARIRDFERNFQRANKTANDNFGRIESRARQSGQRLEADLNRSSASVVASFQKMGAGIGRVFGIAGIAGGATAGGIVAAIKSAASSLAEVGAEARKAGLASDVFQELSFAAQQSKVDINALADGMKELQLRADEFIVTGKGPAAEAFQRIGLSQAELKTRLQDPAELLNEIIRRVQTLDKASQIRVFDELFGGTGGEQFVRFLDGGVEAMNRLRQEARDTGNVLADDVLKKAEEIDKQFNKITTTIGTNLKGAIVSVVAAMQDFWTRLNPEKQGSLIEQTLQEVEKTISGVRARIADAEMTHNKVIIGDLTKMLERLETERAELRRAVNVLNFSKGNAATPSTAPAAATPAATPWAPIKPPMSDELKRQFSAFVDAGEEARLSTYQKALENVGDAYDELATKISAAGLAADTEREMLHQLEVAREAQLNAIRERSEAEEFAIQKMERSQAVMQGELAILQTAGLSYDQMTEALKRFNYEKEIQAELDAKTKELRDLGVNDADIQRLIAAQHQLADSTYLARDAYVKLGEQQAEAKALANELAGAFTQSVSSVIFDAKSAEDALAGLIRKLAEAALQAAIIKPTQNWFATLIQGIGMAVSASAKGNAFVNGRLVPFAKGGLTRGPELFPFQQGGTTRMGVRGEAGTEAIMPVRRLPNGDLGVQAMGGGSGGVVINAPITVNVSGGSQGPAADQELATDIGHAVDAAVSQRFTELLRQQMRPGNMLNNNGFA